MAKLKIIIVSAAVAGLGLSFYFLPVFENQKVAFFGLFEDADEKLVQEIKTLLDEKKYGQVLEKSRELVEKYPDSDKKDFALHSIGIADIELKDYGTALTEFEKLANEFPESKYAADALYQTAAIYYYQKTDGAKAMEYLDKIKEDFGDSSNALIINKVANAEELRQKINAEEHFKVAQYWLRELHYQEALQEYQNIIDNPWLEEGRMSYILLGIGICQLNLKHDDESLAAFQNLIDNYPNDAVMPRAYYCMALIYVHKGKISKTYEYLNKIYNEYPEIRNSETNPLKYEIDNFELMLKQLS